MWKKSGHVEQTHHISSSDFCKSLFVISRCRERPPTDLIFRGLDHVISMLIATSSTELKRSGGKLKGKEREREGGGEEEKEKAEHMPHTTHAERLLCSARAMGLLQKKTGWRINKRHLHYINRIFSSAVNMVKTAVCACGRIKGSFWDKSSCSPCLESRPIPRLFLNTLLIITGELPNGFPSTHTQVRNTAASTGSTSKTHHTVYTLIVMLISILKYAVLQAHHRTCYNPILRYLNLQHQD